MVDLPCKNVIPCCEGNELGEETRTGGGGPVSEAGLPVLLPENHKCMCN